MTQGATIAAGLAAALHSRGTRRAFGIPGGGSSLDLIDTFAEHGIEFVLTHTETAAAIMAAVTAEISGTPGVVITGVGPGAASVVNGIAYASLERAPVLLITDCSDDEPGVFAVHQRFDQSALFAPLTKASRKVAPADGVAPIEALLETALRPPRGPVHVDLSAQVARAPLADDRAESSRGGAVADRPDAPKSAAVAAARALLAAASRPVIIAGLEARDAPGPSALRALADRLHCPVMTTYKAKGTLPETDARSVGCFTGAAAEAECVDRADLIVFFGLDPVELIPHRWRHAAPVLAMSPGVEHTYPVEPAAALIGALDQCVAGVSDVERQSAWSLDEMAALREHLRARLALPGGKGHTAQDVVEAARAEAPEGCRITVDAGAHMLSTLSAWQASRPFDVLKSNGLSTMGYALPAAIAAWLHEPDRPTLAFTGDGGLTMCLAELATAARQGCNITVVVFNDAALSLIDIKQQRQGRARLGVGYAEMDFAAVAEGLGCSAFRVDADGSLRATLAEAFRVKGPAVVDVTLDPSGYRAQLEALRG